MTIDMEGFTKPCGYLGINVSAEDAEKGIDYGANGTGDEAAGFKEVK